MGISVTEERREAARAFMARKDVTSKREYGRLFYRISHPLNYAVTRHVTGEMAIAYQIGTGNIVEVRPR